MCPPPSQLLSFSHAYQKLIMCLFNLSCLNTEKFLNFKSFESFSKDLSHYLLKITLSTKTLSLDFNFKGGFLRCLLKFSVTFFAFDLWLPCFNLTNDPPALIRSCMKLIS